MIGAATIRRMADPPINQLLQQAMEHHRAGRMADAERGYRQILAADPNNADALHLLGVLAASAGQVQAGVDLIGRALAVRPEDPDLLDNLAAVLANAGRSDEAAAATGRARAIRDDPTPLIFAGDAFRQQKKFDQARDCYQRAAMIRPDMGAAHAALGSLLLEQHQIPQAIGALTRAAQLSPDNSTVFRELGIAHLQLQRFNDSIDACRRALEIDPEDALALCHLGLALRRVGKGEEGDTCLERVVTLPASGPAQIFNRAVALECLERYEEAAEAYKRTIAFDPSAISSHLNVGGAMQRLGRLDEAMRWLDTVLALAPNYPLVHLDRGVVLLTQGNFIEGWKEYDWRWKCPERHPPPREFPQPLWRDQDVSGKTVLLHAEQGIGDAIQFSRYAPMVKARGARVILEVHRELVTLARTIAGVDQVIAQDDPIPEFDLHSPLMDLPLIFGTTLRKVPANVPYMSVAADKIAAVERAARPRMKPQGRPSLRVGLVWAGRPTHPLDRTRSIRLEIFAPLASLSEAGISFLTLQKGPAAAQLQDAPAGLMLRDYTADLHDLSDTAALLENLDLVVCVDTSIAHLAGALNRPAWVLIAHAPDWRWLDRREDSPWYPSLRLFRQQTRGDWEVGRSPRL